MKKYLYLKGKYNPLEKFNLKMKLTTLCLFMIIFGLHAKDSYSQKAKVTLNMEDVSIRDVINEIESSTKFKFIYKTKDVNLERKVSIKLNKVSIKKVLKNLFYDNKVEYWVRGTQVLLLQKKSSSSTITKKLQQQGIVKIIGTVNDESGVSLPGVNVFIKGTATGTQTDFDGNYTINANVGDILVFSYVGYATQEITVAVETTTVNVVMKEDVSELDEVVLVAYGSQKRKSVAGSVSTVKADFIQNIKQANPLQGLTGAIAGVRIAAGSGQPGEAPQIQIRGLNSLHSLDGPLYVVDGIPLDMNILPQQNKQEGEFDTSNLGTSISQMASINPNDIESITVLKDAVAASLYGSRAAGGVVLITTKSGKGKEPSISINYSTSIRTPAVKTNYITDPGQYYELYFQKMRNILVTNGETPEEASRLAAANLIEDIDGTGINALGYNAFNVPNGELIDPLTGKLNPNASLLWSDDWSDGVTIDTPISQDIHTSISGGGENGSYYFSLGHSDTESFIKNTDYKRTTLRMRLSQDINDNLNIKGQLSYSFADKNLTNLSGGSIGSGGNPILFANGIAPIYPIYQRDTQGNLILDSNGNRQYDFGDGHDEDGSTVHDRPVFGSNNPLQTLDNDTRTQAYNDVTAMFRAEYKFLNDFTFAYQYSNTFGDSKFKLFVDRPSRGITGSLYRENSFKTTSVTHQQLLTWKRDFDKHSFDLLLGHETNDKHFEDIFAAKENFFISLAPTLSSAFDVNALNGRGYDYKVEGYFSRLIYGYNDRYFINASFRRDGTSVFHPDQRWGNFYGIGGSWLASDEAFLEDVAWLDNLRFKLSYGQQGNDGVIYPPSILGTDIVARLPRGRNYFTYEDQYIVVGTADAPGITHAYSGNKDLAWETSTNFNIGFETSLFNRRVSIEAEYFTQNITDMLFNDETFLSQGIPAIPRNIGDMVNRGIEVNLSTKLIEKENFKWRFSLNATHVKNEILKLAPEAKNTLYRRFFNLEEGRSAYDFYLLEFRDVDDETGNPLFTELDDEGNETGETTSNGSEDFRKYIGKSAEPDLYGGFNTYFKYKNISLSANFSYQIGGYGYDNTLSDIRNFSAGSGTTTDVFDGTWTPENPTAALPRVGSLSFNSSHNLTEATYLSFENVQVEYDFPEKLVSKLKVDNFSIYVSASNLMITSKRKGYDPRKNLVGLSNSGQYGTSTVTTLGLRLKF